MPTAQLNGIGKSKIEIFLPDRSSPYYSYTFPLTEDGGFTFQYEEDSFKHVLQNLDSTAPSKQLVKFMVGFWTKFMLSWENFPLPIADARAIINTLNAQGRGRVVNTFRFTPKITIPDLWWNTLPVLPNNTLQLLNSDSDICKRGNFGMVIGFEAVETDAFIRSVNPNDIQYPGSLDLPYVGPIET